MYFLNNQLSSDQVKMFNDEQISLKIINDDYTKIRAKRMDFTKDFLFRNRCYKCREFFDYEFLTTRPYGNKTRYICFDCYDNLKWIKS
jgi:hypothetical protein